MLKTQILTQQIALRLEFWNKNGVHIDKNGVHIDKQRSSEIFWKRLTTLNTWKGTKYHKFLRDIADFIQNLWLCNIATVMVQYMQIRVLLVSWLRRGRVRAIIADCIQPAMYRSWWGLDEVSFLVCRFLFIQIVFVCLQSSLEGWRLQNRGWVLGCGLRWSYMVLDHLRSS